jgi:tetratricopeptide (TPR) repeat protein
VESTEIAIQHVGYQDPALRRRKLERDLRLLHLEFQEQPDDPFTLFNLGMTYLEDGRAAEGVPHLEKSLRLSHREDSIVRKLYVLIAQGQQRLQQRPEALATCRAGLSVHPDNAELRYQEALLLCDLGERGAAIQCLQCLLAMPNGGQFNSIAGGLQGYRTRHQLGVLLKAEGREVEAETEWQTAVAEEPRYVPAWVSLAELYLGHDRLGDVERVIEQLEALPDATLEATVIRARLHQHRKDYPLARQVLDRGITQAPQALIPRVLLSHVLLQEGRDWAAAEQALLDVLILAPGHREAMQNLAVLRRQRSEGIAS